MTICYTCFYSKLDIKKYKIVRFDMYGARCSICKKIIIKDFMAELNGGHKRYWRSEIERLCFNKKISDLNQIRYVDFYNEGFKDLPLMIKSCKNITHLNLNKNNLSTLPLYLCEYNLKVVAINHNNLIQIPFVIYLLEKLEILWIKENNINEDQLIQLQKKKPNLIIK